MGRAFWIRRFVVVLAGAFVVLAAGPLLRGHTSEQAATQGLVWAAVSTAVFIAARLYPSRQGRHRALCRDTPETRRTPRG